MGEVFELNAKRNEGRAFSIGIIYALTVVDDFEVRYGVKVPNKEEFIRSCFREVTDVGNYTLEVTRYMQLSKNSSIPTEVAMHLAYELAQSVFWFYYVEYEDGKLCRRNAFLQNNIALCTLKPVNNEEEAVFIKKVKDLFREEPALSIISVICILALAMSVPAMIFL